jgi:hypothetical protein
MPTKIWRVTVDDDLAVMVEAYCRAQHEPTDRLPVIRRVLREYVNHRLKDRSFRKRFERERATLVASRPRGLRLMKASTAEP